MPSGPTFRFDSYEVDTRAGELRKHGTRIKLQGKPFAVLVALLERPGEVVTRDELRARLWSADTFVDFEHSLGVAVRKLRTALCETAEQTRYIETIPRRGFRFVGSVAAGSAGKMMLAVLPLSADGSSEGEREFADGLTDEFITQLGRLNPRALGVIARGSAMTYRGTTKNVAEVARELGVEYVLEGAVRRDRKQVRVSARLIGARDQAQLWTETYESPAKQLLQLQAKVARELASALAVELLVAPAEMARGSSKNDAARDRYRLGRSQWNQRTVQGVERALAYFRQAVEADLGFALAHTGLADAYSLLGYYGVLSPKEAFGKARAAVDIALAIDDALAEAHCSLAFILLQHEWDWPAAEREHRRALELNENYAAAQHWYGIDLTQTGRFAEAEASLKRAIALDPLDVATHAHLGRLRYFERRYPEAIKILGKVVRADPSYAPAQYFLGLARAQVREYAEAIARLQAAALLAPEHPAVMSALAYVYGKAKRPFHALEVRDRLQKIAGERYVSPLYLAFASASLGDAGQMFAHLEQAREDRSPWMLYLPIEPAFDGLHEDKRWAGLLASVDPLRKQKRAAASD